MAWTSEQAELLEEAGALAPASFASWWPRGRPDFDPVARRGHTLVVLASAVPAWLAAAGAVLAGFVSGILSALLGIGGAIVTTPAVRILGGTPIEAVGSTVPAIVPSAISGAWRYSREGLVEWRLALGLGIPGSIASVGGAIASDHVNGHVLMVMTAAIMLWAGLTVVWQHRGRSAADAGELGALEVDEPEAPPPTAPHDSIPLVVALGTMAGLVAGLLGVGGGIVLVPVLVGPLGVPMRRAVASSLVAVAIFQIPALITHIALGHVNWALALPLMVGAVPGAQVGARITLSTSDQALRKLFGVLIVVLAVVYGTVEVRSLLAGG